MSRVAEFMEYADFEWATRLNRLVLSSVGIWPAVHKTTSEKVLSDLRAMIAFIFIAFVGAIPGIYSLVRSWGDMMSTIDNLQYTLPLMTATMKLVVVWWKKTDLTVAIDIVAEDWLKTKTDKEQCVMIRRAHLARLLALIGYTFMFVGFSILMVLPCFGTTVRYTTNITDPDKLLPLQTHYLYDKNRSPNFELTFVAQAILGFAAACSYTGVDNLFGLLVFHLCGQMENLKEKLIDLRKFETFHDGLTFVVKDHIRLIKCFDIIENTFTLLLLGLLLYFGTLFCLYGFLVISIITEGRGMSLMRFLYVVSVAVNLSCHMCIFCAVGEVLVTQCDGIHHAAYEYDWYKLNPNEAKTLILIMIRANKPLYITAGKMFPMTMSMFCNLLKTSAGYVSILLAMQG